MPGRVPLSRTRTRPAPPALDLHAVVRRTDRVLNTSQDEQWHAVE